MIFSPPSSPSLPSLAFCPRCGGRRRPGWGCLSPEGRQHLRRLDLAGPGYRRRRADRRANPRRLWVPTTAVNSQTVFAGDDASNAIVAAAMASPRATTETVDCSDCGCDGSTPNLCDSDHPDGSWTGTKTVSVTVQVDSYCVRGYAVPGDGGGGDPYWFAPLGGELGHAGYNKSFQWCLKYPSFSRTGTTEVDWGDGFATSGEEDNVGYVGTHYQSYDIPVSGPGPGDPGCFETGESWEPTKGTFRWTAYMFITCQPPDDDTPYWHFVYFAEAGVDIPQGWGGAMAGVGTTWEGIGFPSTLTRVFTSPGDYVAGIGDAYGESPASITLTLAVS